MKKNNNGFSLVELMVVIAIMAILMGFASYSFGLIFSSSAKECAQKLSSQLYETRTGSMCRYGEELTIYYHKNSGSGDEYTDGYYIQRATYTIKNDGTQELLSDKETKKIASSRVKITAYLEGDSTPITINNATSIAISYQHSSGAFDYGIIDGVPTSYYFEKIVIESGNKVYTIKMVPETGKHSIE